MVNTLDLDLGALLRQYRGGRSMRAMARESGYSVATIKRIEDNEVALPGRDVLRALARAYGAPFGALALAAYRAEEGTNLDELRVPRS